MSSFCISVQLDLRPAFLHWATRLHRPQQARLLTWSWWDEVFRGCQDTCLSGHSRHLSCLIVSFDLSPVSVCLLSALLCMWVCVCVCAMCSWNYSAENTPHSFGPVLAIELSICGRWKRRETGKGNSLLDLGARFLFFSSSFCCFGWN